MSYKEALVRKRNGDFQETSSTNNLSPKHLESSTASFASETFKNNLPTSSRNNSEDTLSLGRFGKEVPGIVLWNPAMANRNSMFNLMPLVSVDTHLQNTFVELQRYVPWSTQCDDKPVQDVFHFSPTPIVEKPFFNLFLHRSYNLAKTVVYFTIQVHNLPKRMQLDASKFAALVATPEKKYEPCFVHDVDSIMVNSFKCSFWAENDGDYIVMVGILIPKEFWSQVNNASEHQGFVFGTLDIPVWRNYAEDCKQECLLIDCEYKTSQGRTGPGLFQYLALENFQQRNESRFWGLTADQQTNNLLYTDRVANEVICVHPAGHTLFRFGQRGSSEAKLYRPTGIAHDDVYSRLIIADTDNHRICFFDMDGHYISSFGTAGHENGQLHYPWDVAVSQDGQHIVVSDSRNKRVQLFDRFGNFLRKYCLKLYKISTLGCKTEWDFDPRGITFDGTGKNIYVIDLYGQNLARIPIDFLRHPPSVIFPERLLHRPQGIAMDWRGNLLIADTNNHCIRYVSSQSGVISNISRVLEQPLEFPVNVATLAGGFVGVLCSTGKIRIF